MRRISFCSDLRSFASIAESGSSRSRTFGSVTMERASATRCCCPPESSEGIAFSRPSSATISTAFLTFADISSCGVFFMRRPKAMLSNTFMFGKRLYCWKTMPISRLLGSV